MKPKPSGLGVVVAVMCLAQTACVVGPKYQPPVTANPTAPNYKESPINFTDTNGWKVAQPKDAMLRGNWWEVFHEPELNEFERQLNIDNQNIKQAFENYMAARTQIRQAHAQYYPTVSVSAGVTPMKARSPAPISPTTCPAIWTRADETRWIKAITAPQHLLIGQKSALSRTQFPPYPEKSRSGYLMLQLRSFSP